LILERIQKRHADSPEHDKPVVFYRAEIKSASVDWKNRLVQGIVSMETVDMEGEVVVQDGIDLKYFWSEDSKRKGVRTVYWDHDYDEPIGKCRNIERKGDGLYACTEITKLPIGDEILCLIEEEIVKGQSIGFRPVERGDPTVEEIQKYGPECELITRKSIMLEYSITPAPCNPDAILKNQERLNKLVAKSRVSHRTALMLNLAPKPSPTLVMAPGGRYIIE
jgi:HK97 family phage prohead protease